MRSCSGNFAPQVFFTLSNGCVVVLLIDGILKLKEKGLKCFLFKGQKNKRPPDKKTDIKRGGGGVGGWGGGGGGGGCSRVISNIAWHLKGLTLILCVSA